MNLINRLKGKTVIGIFLSIRRRTFWRFKRLFFGSFGRHSIMDKPLMIYNKKNIYIGERVTIRPGLRIEPIKSYGAQNFENPQIIIEDGTTIEQNCHITCANKVHIGKNVTIAGYSMITDIDHEYRNINMGILEQELIVKETYIDEECFIGMGARIMPGVHIGKHCIVGTNSIVTKDVPDYSVIVGAPAKIVKRYNPNLKKWLNVNEKGEFVKYE